MPLCAEPRAAGRVLRAAGLVLLIVGGLCAVAQSHNDGMVAIADGFAKEHQVPGLAIAVIRGGRTYTHVLGVRRLAGDDSISTRTVFHMASVSKLFVVTAVMQLVERGQVDLNAPVRRYVAEFRMKDVSGQEFESYVQKHILGPLGMVHSMLLMTDVDSANLAWGHVRHHGKVEAAQVYPYNRPHAGSSTLHADLNDMIRWAEANLQRGHLGRQRILRSSTYPLLWNPTRDLTSDMRDVFQKADVPFPYQSYGIGIGWFVAEHDGHRLVFHEGSDRGFVSYLMLAPDDSAAVIIMANLSGLDIEPFALRLMDWALTN